MFNKKAQAAMEFLMTYGWAILVVLVAIGALAYFGVLSPDKFLPERCTGTAGLDCVDKAVIEDNRLQISLRNNLGYTIRIDMDTAPTVTDIGGCATPTDEEWNITIPRGDNAGCYSGTLNIPHGSCSTATGLPSPYGVTTLRGTVANISNNEPFIVTVGCDSTIEGPRVKGDITFKYTNRETGLTHNAVTSIAGRTS
ncbi:hypothetical protein GOV09_04890 [Candidatus Woesearchaeota archaeon]|nr:hypothetical protein [Candidatus Woesearchaeota archaeon]